MKRFMLIDSMRVDTIKLNYLNAEFFDCLEDAIIEAQKLQKAWIVKTVDYIRHIYNKTEVPILWSTTK